MSNMADLGFSFAKYIDQYVFTWNGWSQTVAKYVDQTLDNLNLMRKD